jgi:hypothetical protein
MNRLLLCAGIHRRQGWLRLDADPRCEPDFVASIPPLPTVVKLMHWDEIEWIHGVTSLYPWDAKTALAELYAVLVPGGKLVLEQPDFSTAIDRPEWLFGDPSHRDPLIMNRWSYTPNSLSLLLLEAGFGRIDVLPAQHHMPARDFRIEAYK